MASGRLLLRVITADVKWSTAIFTAVKAQQKRLLPQLGLPSIGPVKFFISFLSQDWFLNRFPRTALKTDRYFCCSEARQVIQ